MTNELSREEILERLNRQVFGEFQEYLLSSISKERASLEELVQPAADQLQSKNTDQAVKTLVAKLQKQVLPEEQGSNKEEAETPELHSIPWLEELHAICDELEETITLPQAEDRFTATPSDPAFTKLGKLGKKTLRGIQKAGRATGALFSSSKPEPVIWQQSIPLQNLIAFHLMDAHEPLAFWENQRNRIQAEILLELDAWTLHSSGLIKQEPSPDVSEESQTEENQGSRSAENDPAKPDHIPNQEDMEAFFEEVLKELERIHKETEEKLQRQFERIYEDVSKALSVTGTIERSAGDFTADVITKQKKKLRNQLKEDGQKWAEITKALIDRCQLSIDFITLYEQAEERIGGFGDSIEEFFTNSFEEPAHNLFEQLEEARALFSESDTHSQKEVQELSQEYEQKMNEFIEEQLLKPAHQLIEDAVLGTKLERFTSAIPDWTKRQREQAVLVEELDLTILPPKYELENVDWQSLVQRVLNNQIAKVFVPKEVKPEEFLSEVHTDIQEIAQIIRTNIEIADEVKKSDAENPFQVVREGLERAQGKLEELIEKIVQKKQELLVKLKEKNQFAFSKLAILLEKQNVNELRLAGAQYKAKETAVDWKIKLQVYWANVSEKAELFGRFIWRKLKSYYEIVSKFLGFAEKEKLEGDTTDLATFLSQTDEKIAQLPFIYRRLFDFHKEVEERFYIRKPEQFDRLKKGYDLWQNNFPSSFSIVGEKGSGKSLFIRMLQNEVITNHDVIEIDFKDTLWKPEDVLSYVGKAMKIEEVKSLEELIEAIKRKRKRVVVILENVQNCFIRNISGFDAIEQLLLLISETNKEILWIASSTRYGWLYLDKVLNVVDYFTHAVETDNLSAKQIEELILKRHRASGYQLKFIPDETTKNSRSYKKHLGDEEKAQEYLKDRYFEKLARLSEGNSSVAMIYWIRSIKKFDDTNFYINPFDFGAVNRLQELDSNELFALAAFILHDSMTAQELSLAIHQSLRESRLTVSRLSSQSILVEAEYGFSLNQLIYRQIARALKEANFIH